MAVTNITLGTGIYIALASTALVLSVFGNLCVILVIVRNKDMRTATNLFIGNLALSDIVMGGILLPQNIHDLSHTGDYDEGLFLCKVVTALPLICITGSIYSLVAMAIERYRAICTTSGIMKIASAKKIIAMIWVWSAIVIVPTLAEYGVYVDYSTPVLGITNRSTSALGNSTSKQAETTQQLTTETTGPFTDVPENVGNGQLLYYRVCGNIQGILYGLINGLFLFSVAYIVPLFIITFCYGKVGHFIVIKTKEQESGQGGKSFSVSKNKVRILQMLIMVAALFAVSWCPYFIILLIAKSTGTDDTGDATSPLNLFKLSLSIFSVSYNVFIYITYTNSFRLGMKNLLCQGQAKVMPEGETVMENSIVTNE